MSRDRALDRSPCPPSLVILALLLIELQSRLLFESVIQTARPSGGSKQLKVSGDRA